MSKSKPEHWPGMSKKKFHRIGKYVRRRADDLNLRDWTIHLLHEPLASDCEHAAEITVTYGRAHASISLARHFLTYEPAVQRETLVHELIHIHLDPIEARFRRRGGDGSIWAHLGDLAAGVIIDEVHHDIERATDAIAHAVALGCPLPEFG